MPLAKMSFGVKVERGQLVRVLVFKLTAGHPTFGIRLVDTL